MRMTLAMLRSSAMTAICVPDSRDAIIIIFSIFWTYCSRVNSVCFLSLDFESMAQSDWKCEKPKQQHSSTRTCAVCLVPHGREGGGCHTDDVHRRRAGNLIGLNYATASGKMRSEVPAECVTRRQIYLHLECKLTSDWLSSARWPLPSWNMHVFWERRWMKGDKNGQTFNLRRAPALLCRYGRYARGFLSDAIWFIQSWWAVKLDEKNHRRTANSHVYLLITASNRPIMRTFESLASPALASN